MRKTPHVPCALLVVLVAWPAEAKDSAYHLGCVISGVTGLFVCPEHRMDVENNCADLMAMDPNYVCRGTRPYTGDHDSGAFSNPFVSEPINRLGGAGGTTRQLEEMQRYLNLF